MVLEAGAFRLLTWEGNASLPTSIFLHGLGDVADVWSWTMDALRDRHGPILALDQRGHGGSPIPSGPGSFTALRMARDVVELIEEEGISHPNIVGHSMGGRAAMVLASRFSELIRSVAIVDIGPEAWAANCEESVAALEGRPRGFASRSDVLEFAGRRRTLSKADEQMFLSRVEQSGDGRFTWRGSEDAMKKIVRTQRLRNYWWEWGEVKPPALLIRGKRTRELRPRILERMRSLNPMVSFVEIAESSHNVPLVAPARLAEELESFWRGIG